VAGCAMSFTRARALITFVAVVIWLAALTGRHLGVGRSVCSAGRLVTAVLLAAVLCALVGGRVWGRVRYAARQNAARAAAMAQQPRTRDGMGSLAWQARAATGAVGCAAMFVCGDRGSAVPRSMFSAAGRSGRRGHAIGPDTRFEIGSLTKIFTGLILADMAVRNNVDLETPVGALLGVPAAEALTLRSLATHTSGLPRRITGPHLAALLTVHHDPYRGTDLDRVTTALARRPPPVGGTFRYSNVGYQLLAAALAAAAGTTWPELLQQRICGPLGLTATGMSPDRNTARGHDEAGFPFPYSDYTLLPGAIGLFSSASDLGRFLHAQLAPWSTPLGPAIRLSRTVQTPPGCSLQAGLGWRLKTAGDASLAWHRGLTHGFGALLAVIDAPDSQRGLAILVNSPAAATLQAVGLRTVRGGLLEGGFA
jgi:D-alanyl-D-alanine-carboxypeptidase/D-alanyl-D-alanine-endopeptidase